MTRQRSVLLVDAAEAAEVLRSSGFQVTRAESFATAWEHLCEAPPDALVTELRLSEFNGLHLILRLRRHSPESIAVVYTAFPDPVLEQHTRQIGANYLLKDGDGSHLAALLADHLKLADNLPQDWHGPPVSTLD